MCLTGVDYFSTLGYQPGIAALAAGALSPLATLVLVLLTLFGALPVYRRVAEESPHGEGSIAMLERLLSFWKGKLFVLVLLGFAATDFIITMTPQRRRRQRAPGREPQPQHRARRARSSGSPSACWRCSAGCSCAGSPRRSGSRSRWSRSTSRSTSSSSASGSGTSPPTRVVTDWTTALTTQHGDPLMMVAVALLVFPKLALGMSGFETGVAVMPHVRGDASDTEAAPRGRIRDTKRLLTTAALIMSVFLVTSSIVTTLLIPAAEFEDGGAANGRALAYLAHDYLGNAFGTTYDVSTIAILWFAGASAMAGLLNLIPRYLPRYGMAPDWAARGAAAGAGAHRDGLPDHLDLRRRRRRPGRRLRDRRAGADHQRRGRGDPGRPPGRAAQGHGRASR